MTIKFGRHSIQHVDANITRMSLQKINSKYFLENRVFLEIKEITYQEFLALEFFSNTRLIIEPKICGYLLALYYEKGSLRQLINKDFTEDSKLIRETKGVPQNIPLSKNTLIKGICYEPKENNICSANTSTIKTKSIPLKKYSYEFCAFEIINSSLNHYSQLNFLRKIGFRIPANEYIRRNSSEVLLYQSLFLDGKLFQYDCPVNGLVLKINSKKYQNQILEDKGFNQTSFILKIN